MSCATPDGTRRYAEKMVSQGLAPNAYRVLGKTELQVSAMGFGGYRIDNETPEHRASLERALQKGSNLIDTSSNYTDGGSETCVGKTLEALIKSGPLQRDEVIVVSKVGYVQGQNLDLAEAKEQHGEPYPEMVKYMEGCWHCIHPEFITEQLTKSLERLRLEKVDVYLLHNPEYFFSDAVKHQSKTPILELREQFYKRIKNAFYQLEEEVAEGRISSYGVSSNTFGASSEDPEMTSLSRMLSIAQEVAKDRCGDSTQHHFTTAQVPMNLFEGEAALESNNGKEENQTVLEFASKNGLAVLVNRPLNAIIGNQMIRLADFQAREMTESADDLAKKIVLLEDEFATQIAPHVQTGQQSVPAQDFFRWGAELSNAEMQSMAVEQWDQIESQVIRAQIHYLMVRLDEHFTGPTNDLWKGWRDRYLPPLEKLLLVIRNECAKNSQKISRTVSQRLDGFLPSGLQKESLSRKCLAILANTTGVTSVLNGMRRQEYVDDSLGILAIKPFKVEPSLFKTFRLDT